MRPMIAQASIWFALAVSIFIIGTILAIVAAFKTYEKRQLKRMKALTCPNCHQSFEVSSYAGVQRWMARDAKVSSGFYLKCAGCSVEFRFANNFQCLGPVTAL